MPKIAVLVADAFPDSEYFLPKIEIEKLGVETETISIGRQPGITSPPSIRSWS